MSEARSRVFISCGQRADSGEVAAAQRVAERLAAIGYEPYIATEQHSLRSLRENIFERLRDSEYLLFIDFPREQLLQADGKDVKYRGSLFAHQELAIASYLGLEVLAFQHRDVRRLDGLIGHLQLNPAEFDENTDIVDLVENAVRSSWSPAWRRQLRLSLDRKVHTPTELSRGRELWFYLIRVENGHRSVVARDCMAYLRKVVSLTDGKEIEFATAELKWAGTPQPSVAIMPEGFREVDAIVIDPSCPATPLFSILTDSSRHRPEVSGPGRWKLTYEVLSSNVASASLEVIAELDGTKTGVRICELGTDPMPSPRQDSSGLRLTTTNQVLEGGDVKRL